MTGTKLLGRRLSIIAAQILLIVVLVAAGAGFWLRSRMVASLPTLDGDARLGGLASSVKITRDALGVATISGSSRLDVARATGWLHAQDRFFQMDVLRRRGGGELSEIFGSATLPLDREARMHGFLRLAHEVLEREPAGHRAIIQAYTEGVNAGLAALHAKPWEYSVLRIEPKPWTPEDIVLVNFAMTLDLQEGTGHYVRVLATIRDEMGPASLAFFAPLYTTGDAALDGSTGPVPPLPPASEVDLRTGDTPAPTTSLGNASWPDNETPGSNNMAVAGSLAAGGGALVANDMHLHLSVPNIWYRLSLKWPGHEETGVTLPGVPVIVAGSTGKLAWGFTNSDAGTGDIIVVDPSISPEMYHGPHGGDLVAYERRTETVPVRGSKAATMEFKWTVWGPVVAEGANGHQLVYHWSADDPAATNLAIIDLEDASGVRSAIAVAHRMGIAAQNFVVADSEGQIAWTVAGQIPRRVGYDGRLPVTWLYGDRRWDGYLGDEAPSIISPANGFLWTANNRTVGGKALAELGDAGYDIPARARQIRDDLSALVGAGRPVEPRDLLSIELDDRGMMLAPRHDLMVEALKPDAGPANPGRSALLEAAQKWDGRADTSSVGYRVVRDFRLAVAHRVLDPIFAACVERDPDFTWTRLNYEQPLLAIIRGRPANLLDPGYHGWADLLGAAADDVSAAYAKHGLDPRSATWGQRNTARIEHPFGRMLPWWLARYISMPADELPGDSHMPRWQDVDFGSSERFVVSPGREASGIFHMPGGQVSNPCSPFFRAGHESWVHGDPTPFLPGMTEHTVALAP